MKISNFLLKTKNCFGLQGYFRVRISELRIDPKGKLKTSSGFTLIEVILVMAMTALAFTAIYALYAQTVKYDLENRYEIVAAGLAQEGVEMIRNRRDLLLTNREFGNTNGLVATCYPNFYLDIQDKPIYCGDTADYSSSIKISSDIYSNSNSGTISTPFSRTCSISNLNDFPNVNLSVSCTVSWTSVVTGGTRSSVVSSVLSDWVE